MIGTAYGSTIESLDNPKEGMELNGLWVHPKFCYKGIAKNLLKELCKDFHRIGVLRLVVYNFHHSGFNAFYKHLGFRVIETE